MKAVRTVAPATEFISVAEAAFNVAGDATYDATKLARDITAAIAKAENYCERAFINQTWSFALDKFPSVTVQNPKAAIFIPKGRFVSLTSNQIAYTDTDGDAQTLTLNTDFYMDTLGDIARIWPISSGWPSTNTDRPNVVTFSCVLGHGTSLPADMMDVKSACLLEIGTLYETRQSKLPVSKFMDTELFERYLHPYKIYFDFSINDV